MAAKRKAIGRWIVVAGVILIGSGAIARLYLRSGPGRRAAAASHGVTGRIVPDGVRVKIEVLNATDTKGLARAATFVLRDAGFDVVFFGNTSERTDTTIVLDRSGHADWASLAARAMGRAHVDEKPDSSRFLDLTVLVGRNWAPPREPLNP